MTKNLLVIILIAVVIFLLMTQPDYTKKEIVLKTDTIFNVKTLTKYKKGDSIPYVIIAQDTIQIPVHDTIRIINEYLQIKAYSDTIRIDSNAFYIQDTISQNKIIGRGFEAKLQEKTIYITKTIKPKTELLIGGELRNSNNVLGASIGLGLKVPNKGVILLNYGTQGYSVGYYKKLF
jgi:hypothetical protein